MGGRALTTIDAESAQHGLVEVSHGDVKVVDRFDGKICATGRVMVSARASGEIRAEDVVVRGSFRGRLTCKTLIVCEHGWVDGEVSVRGEVTVAGTLSGAVTSAALSVHSSGRLVGRARCKELRVLPGAETQDCEINHAESKPSRYVVWLGRSRQGQQGPSFGALRDALLFVEQHNGPFEINLPNGRRLRGDNGLEVSASPSPI